jgi:ABC-type microcin C transport system permease subunit YejB
VVSFVITQFAPGGPVENYIAQLSGQSVSVSEGVIGNAEGDFAGQHELHHVAGHHPQQHVGNDRNAEQRRDHQQQASQDVGAQWRLQSSKVSSG